ncbi:MAG: HNH endonuclease [Desulfobacteraceae bacterium]|nr:MAG: HNH endonuclease [Desulfobacteraceae bacterium]
MKRKISEEFKKARRKMVERRTICHECEDYATELHHIIAVEDGGTDDIENLMPLCKECHKEYTSEQTTERNKMWVALNIDDSGGVTAQFKGDQEIVPIGKITNGFEEKLTRTDKIHYQYEWIVTVEIPATTERESKEKLKKFKQELFNRYAVTGDVWLTAIRRWNGNK